MLKQRVATAAVLIPLVLLAIWWLPTGGVALLVAGLMLACAWEWSRFVPLNQPARLYFLVAMAVAMGLLHPALFGVASRPVVLVLGLLWWLVAAGWLAAYPRGFGVGRPPAWLRIVLGALIILPCYLALWSLHALEAGRWLIVLLLALVFATDTGGYFAGKSFGRRKLAVQISPNKTWEGLWGGVVFALSLAVLAGFTVLPIRPFPGLLVMALLVSLWSVVGDLTISMFKRQTGIKDTGTLFPGHGGALDRLDSLFPAAPLLLVVYQLLAGG